ncbi:hypothetical protein L2U69_02875 [Zavarzinia compransoris]|uniref:hypothetical protein n=1 Tax=Zavarzinia marina TaxID=2911065 RepID=UPI001F2C318E|nr:hypothetical protein [Zavarzinia marina]MCF4164587.1 hypothetical protein [Zavarzinia marina]
MALTSTQIGAIGENLLASTVMIASGGRLSPFRSVADDDGIDLLFFDKETGGAVAIQLKCRSGAAQGNTVYFEVRKATFQAVRPAYLVAGLLKADLTGFEATWLLPMARLPELATGNTRKWVMQPSKAADTRDRFLPFRSMTDEALAARIAAACHRS